LVRDGTSRSEATADGTARRQSALRPAGSRSTSNQPLQRTHRIRSAMAASVTRSAQLGQTAYGCPTPGRPLTTCSVARDGCQRRTTAQRPPVCDAPRGRVLPAQRSERGTTHRAATRTGRSLPRGHIVLVLHVLDSEHLGQHQRLRKLHILHVCAIYRPRIGHVEAAPQISLDPT